MADRYWVGGNSTWDGTAGTKWASTSGGVGGASLPTSVDDVFFDNKPAPTWISSTTFSTSNIVTPTTGNGLYYECTTAGTSDTIEPTWPTNVNDTVTDGTVVWTCRSASCNISAGNTGAKSINCTNYIGTITGTGNITISGNITLVSGMTYSHTGTITINATSTLITATKQFSTLVIDNTNIVVSLGDALDLSTRSLTVTRGSFLTNNYNVTAGNFNSTNSNARSINFGTSTINLSGNLDFSTPTNLLFSAFTSQINMTGSASVLAGGNQVFHNVSFTNTTNTIITRFGNSHVRSISGNNTFNNLSLVGPASNGVCYVSINGVLTINGTFSTSGTAGNRRIYFQCNVSPTRRNLIINSTPSLTDIDFESFIVLGNAAPISGTRIGNRGNCLNITFSTPKTVYWNLAGSQSFSANGWATSSTSTPNTDNFPLPQDTAILENAGAAGTISFDLSLYLPNIEFTGRTNAMTFNLDTGFAGLVIYGNLRLGTGVSIGGSYILVPAGDNDATMLCNGRAIQGCTVAKMNGAKFTCEDSYNQPGGHTVNVVYGTFDTGGYTHSWGNVELTGSGYIRKLILGTSNISFGGAIAFSYQSSVSNLIVEASQSSLSFFGTGRFALFQAWPNQVFGNVRFTLGNGEFGRVGSAVGLPGPNWTYNNVSFDIITSGISSSNIGTLLITGNTTINGTLSGTDNSSNTIIRRITIRSDVENVRRRITLNALDASNCNFRDIEITGNAVGSSPIRAGDQGNNIGINFPAPKTVYWNLSGNQNWNANGWSNISGGLPDPIYYPLPQDTAVFDNSGAANTVNIFLDHGVGSIDTTSRTLPLTINHNTTLTLYNTYAISANTTLTGTSTLTFFNNNPANNSSQSINVANTIPFPIVINNYNGTINLNNNLVSTSSLNFVRGTFNTNNNSIRLSSFVSNSGVLRTLNNGSSIWNITGNGSIWTTTSSNFNYIPGTSTINLTDETSTARTFAGGGIHFNDLNIQGNTSNSTITITGSNLFNSINSSRTSAYTILFENNSTNIFNNWLITGTANNITTINRVSSGVWNIILSGNRSNVDYLNVNNCTVVDRSPCEFYVGVNSTLTGCTRVLNTVPPAPRTLYWVGGTGNWNDINKWTTTPGVLEGANLPTSVDDIIFNTTSNTTSYTSTVNATTRCNSITITGPTNGNITLAGSSTLISRGNISVPSTGFIRSFTGPIVLSGNTTGLIFSTNNITFASSVEVLGSNCEWNLNGSLITNQTLTITAGKFNTANYNLSTTSISSSTSYQRIIDFGSSIVTLSDTTPISFGLLNHTFNANTSNLVFTSQSATFNGLGYNYNNVYFTSTATAGLVKTINGINTFKNLTFVAGTTDNSIQNILFNNEQIITDTFTISGASPIQRCFIYSNALANTVRITANTLSSSHTDFRDVQISGNASNSSPIGAGDCGGNIGINFPTPKTVYWNLAGNQNFNANGWANTSGGTPDIINYPLPQDIAMFNDSGSANTVNLTPTSFSFNLPELNFSDRTIPVTLTTTSSNPLIHGGYILGTGVTLSGNQTVQLLGRKNCLINTSNSTITFPLIINAPNGIYTLTNTFTGTSSITLTSGTFSANTSNVTLNNFSSSGTGIRTLNMGTGLWTLTGTGTIWDLSTSTNMTLNSNTANVLCNNITTTARTFAGGGFSYNKLTIGGITGISTFTINQSNSFTEIESLKRVAHTISFQTNTYNRCGIWNVNGNAGKLVTITGGSLIYTSNGSVTTSYVNVNNTALGPNFESRGIWLAGTNSVNNGGSIGWEFVPTTSQQNPRGFFMFYK